MLLQDFYKVEKLENVSDGKYVATIQLNKTHDIFKGHFPGNPVTPGVCMMQIIKELTQNITQSKLFMVSSSNVKFMALINSDINSVLKLELEVSSNTETEIKVKNTTSFDDTVALKLSSTFKRV